MRMSQLLGNRFKERPADAVLESHSLLLRGGYIRPMGNGLYSLLPAGLRVAKKIEAILREEMVSLGAQEVQMPLAQPAELREGTGRHGDNGEELAASLVASELRSYAQLPLAIFSIQSKSRDEPRPRGGLIRAREFVMKGLYSFHESQEDLDRFYGACRRTYLKIFARMGLSEVVEVESGTGIMGGPTSHGFALLTDSGEDTIAMCDRCGYKANLDAAQGVFAAFAEPPRAMELAHTPGMKTIEEVAGFLGVEPRQTAKVVFYDADQDGRLVVAMVRGDIEVNEAKLCAIIGREPVAADEERIVAAGMTPGYASPMGIDTGKVMVLVDRSAVESNNLVCGANKADYHYRNFNFERDLSGAAVVDVATAAPGAKCLCGGELEFRRGINLANVRQLGTKCTEPMKVAYTDAEGQVRTPMMGAYGIGVGRLMSAIVEARHDAYGPKWPMSVAPWQVHLNALKLDRPPVREAAENLYAELQRRGVEVLFDDRNLSPGVQFADADLLGATVRLIVSERNLAAGQVEWKRRDSGEAGTVGLGEAVEMVVREVGCMD